MPLRYVITSKWVAAAPQFVVTIRSLAPASATDEPDVTFTPPAGATALGHGDFEAQISA